MKIITCFLVFTFSINLYANQASQIKSPTGVTKVSEVLMPIHQLFDAMREHDGEKLLSQFIKGAMLERATTEDKVDNSDLNDFAKTVSKSTKNLDERIFNITVKQSGNLANVWTPFAFYLDGKLSHCGVNSFVLIKQQGQWKIRYLIDNGYEGDCEAFIAEHKAKEL